MPRDGRYAGSAPEWRPRMPRLNTALALSFVLMLLGATPAMAMAADPQVSTEVFVERGDNPLRAAAGACRCLFNGPCHAARYRAAGSHGGAVGCSAG